jgi:hypothetical protein
LGLLALPLYILLAGDGTARRFWAVSGVVAGVYLVFAWGYLTFPGLKSANSHNQLIFAGLPGLGYLEHLLFGAFFSPFIYLFWGHFHFPDWARVVGIAVLCLSFAAICLWGDSRERRWCLWILLLNALPFVLVSLTRHQRSINQAFVPRYGIFTLIGALLLLGTAWRILSSRTWAPRKASLLAIGLLAVMFAGQIAALPKWEEKYLEISRLSEFCYREYSNANGSAEIYRESFQKFCPGAYPYLTRIQVSAIHRFLSDPWGWHDLFLADHRVSRTMRE